MRVQFLENAPTHEPSVRTADCQSAVPQTASRQAALAKPTPQAGSLRYGRLGNLRYRGRHSFSPTRPNGPPSFPQGAGVAYHPQLLAGSRPSEPSNPIPANPSPCSRKPAARILLLPPGEGRDEGRLQSSSLNGSWSRCVSNSWKTLLPMKSTVCPAPEGAGKHEPTTHSSTWSLTQPPNPPKLPAIHPRRHF